LEFRAALESKLSFGRRIPTMACAGSCVRISLGTPAPPAIGARSSRSWRFSLQSGEFRLYGVSGRLHHAPQW